MDTTSGYKFICGSTKTSNETIEMEDETHAINQKLK